MQKAPNEPQELPPMPPAQEAATDETMGNAQKAPDALPEYVPEYSPSPKSGLFNAIHNAKETILGSGSIPAAISKTKDGFAGFYFGPVKTGLDTLRQVADGNPKGAVNAFAQGLRKNLKALGTIALAAPHLAFAGGASVLGAAKKTAKLPLEVGAQLKKSSLKVWEQMKSSTQKLSNLVS